MARTNKRKSTKKQNSQTPSEQLKDALVAGNTYEAIRLCGTHKFTQKQLESALKAAFAKGQYQCIKEFQSHFDQKEDTSISDNMGIILNKMLCDAFAAGDKDRAILLYTTFNFTPAQLEAAVKIARKKGNYSFLEQFQAHFRQLENVTVDEDVRNISLNNREKTDKDFEKVFSSGKIDDVKRFYQKYDVSMMLAPTYFDALMSRKGMKDSAKFKFLEEFCLYLRDYGREEDATIYASFMARKDKKYLDWAEKNGIKIDWYIYSGGNCMGDFRRSSKYSGPRCIKYSEPTYSSGSNYDSKSVFVPFKEGNLQLAKLAIDYMTYYDFEKAVKLSPNGFLEEFSLYLIENGYTEASSIIVRELVGRDPDKYGKWAKREKMPVDWGMVYSSRIGSNPNENLWKAYIEMWWPNGQKTDKPDLKVFTSAMKRYDLTKVDWTRILEAVSTDPEQIETFFKPLCQYLIQTNQTDVLSKIFNTAVEKGFSNCVAVAFDKNTLSLSTLINMGLSVDVIQTVLNNGVDIDLCDGKGRSPLSAFVVHLSDELKQRRGKELVWDYEREESKKFIDDAALKIELLLTRGVDVNHIDNDGKNVLDHLFAKPENFQDEIWITCINSVLNQEGLEIPLNSTPYLAIALDKMPNQTGLITTLINREPELILQKDENGRNALMLAMEKGEVKLFRYMLEQAQMHGIEIDVTYDECVSMLLFAASNSGGAECLQELSSLGIGVNQQNSKGYTALHQAIQKKDAKALENLLRFGADDQIKTPSGQTVDEMIASVGFSEGAEVLKKARAARGKMSIANANDLLEFVSYATPEQFSKYQEARFPNITDMMLIEAINKAKRADLLPYISKNVNMGDIGSDGRTALEQTALSNHQALDGVTVITDTNPETQGIQGVVSEDYKLFEALLQSIESLDLASFNSLLNQIPPENLLKYNSQGFNPISMADERWRLMEGIAQKKMKGQDLTPKEQKIANSPDFDKKITIIRSMHESLIDKAKVLQKNGYNSSSANFLLTPHLLDQPIPVQIGFKKALEEKDIETLSALVMAKKFLPFEEDCSSIVKLLLEHDKHVELKTLLEFAREEGKLPLFLEGIREGAYVNQQFITSNNANASNVLKHYCELVDDMQDGRAISGSYKDACRFYTGGQFVKSSNAEDIYFLTIAKGIFPPKESGYAVYNRKNVIDCFTDDEVMKKHPEALEIFLKQAKDLGCFDEVLGYITPGDKSKPEIKAAIDAANAHVPVVDRIKKATNDQEIDELENLILNGLEVPPPEDRERIVDSLKKERMSMIVFTTYHQNSEEDAVKTDIVLPKSNDRYKVLSLLIKNNKHEAVKKLLNYAKEKGELKEFLYAFPCDDKNVAPSSTPIELAFRSGDEKMKGIFLSMVSDTDLDFLIDHKPYEQILRDAILSKNKEVLVYLIQSQRYLPPEYQLYDTMRVLIECRDQQTIKALFVLMEKENMDVGEFLNTPDENGVTLLMMAARSGNAEIFDLLLENGAKTDAVDNNGKGVYAHAKSSLRAHLKQKENQPQQQQDTTAMLDMFSQNITQDRGCESLPKSRDGRDMS